MSIIERLTKFRKAINVGQTAFELSIGASRGYLSNIKTIGSDKLNKISNEYPELNIDWLITGNGEMIKKGSSISQIVSGSNNISNAGNMGRVINSHPLKGLHIPDGEISKEQQNLINQLEIKNKEIELKDKEIEMLRKAIEEKERFIELLLSTKK